MASEDDRDELPPDAVTAGELRAAGIPVPVHIPDCAWTRRRGIRVTCPEVKQAHDDKDRYTFTMEYTFAEPFKWIDVTFTLNKDGKD